ncbi:hypothetical protein [Senegalia sp. (in: firmicutes)]|uniref:hypothetical protein n=1 Tax=Senegalia sp. (in: firmicutes) TaxID=1924098 RepID=UPI003F96BED1
MKNKDWKKYLFYILLIFGLLYLDSYILRQRAIYQKETFDVGLTYIVMSMIVKIGVGTVLGLDYIVGEIKKSGSWKINLSKIFLMVVPTLYFSMSFFAMYRFIENPIYKILTYPMFIFFKNDSSFIIASQLMFGYLFVTSFYKQSKEVKS